MLERNPNFSVQDWEKEQSKFSFSSLVSELELERLEGLCRKPAEGWILRRPLERRTEILSWKPIIIRELPTRL